MARAGRKPGVVGDITKRYLQTPDEQLRYAKSRPINTSPVRWRIELRRRALHGNGRNAGMGLIDPEWLMR